MHHRRRQKYQHPRKRRGDEELLADDSCEKADDRLGQPSHADDAARHRILDDSRETAGEHPGHRSARQCYVNHHDQNQIQGCRPADEKPRQGGLQRKRQYDRDENPEGLHSRARLGSDGASSSSAPAGGVTTTRTASTDEESTTGRTTMAPNPLLPRSTDSI